MSAWVEQAEKIPPRRRYPIGSAEDDCLGLLVQINAQADAAWLALYEGETDRAEAIISDLRLAVESALWRLQERDGYRAKEE